MENEKLTDAQLVAIRRINSSVIRSDGTVKSFKEQLLEYEYGYYNARQPFVVLPTSAPLSQAGAQDFPITMDPSLLAKLKDRHDLYPRDIAELPTAISEKNVLMLDSYTYRRGGLCMYLDETGAHDIPLFAAFHLDKMVGTVSVNALRSIYERKNILFTIERTWNDGLRLYPNEKTASWLQSNGLRLPVDLASLLIGRYEVVSKDTIIPARDIVARAASDFKPFGKESAAQAHEKVCLADESASARLASSELGAESGAEHTRNKER